jgi:hypothetical protein
MSNKSERNEHYSVPYGIKGTGIAKIASRQILKLQRRSLKKYTNPTYSLAWVIAQRE